MFLQDLNLFGEEVKPPLDIKDIKFESIEQYMVAMAKSSPLCALSQFNRNSLRNRGRPRSLVDEKQPKWDCLEKKPPLNASARDDSNARLVPYSNESTISAPDEQASDEESIIKYTKYQ